MNNQSHSTQFFLTWVLAGLSLGLLVVVLLSAGHSSFKADFGGNKKITYAKAVELAAPTVVSIQAFTEVVQDNNDEFPLLKKTPVITLRPNQGSGVIIDQKGHILTNFHVVSGADRILVSLNDGHRVEAKIRGSDPDTDLAVLTINHFNHPNIRFADSNHVNVGDVVLAIGNPYGIGMTVSQGIISATGRNRLGLNTYENFIQTDAAINPGNSGGALINSLGEIIGINSRVLSKSGNFQGISFAIPIDMALSVAKEIINHGSVVRGWLGVEGRDLNAQILKLIGLPKARGVLVTEVFQNGPADKAGLKSGDIISRINKTTIRDTRDVLDIIARGRPGESIDIYGIRRRQSFKTSAILAQRPQ